jgi:hypothetical protein
VTAVSLRIEPETSPAPATDVSWTPVGNALVLDDVEATIGPPEPMLQLRALINLPERLRRSIATALLADPKKDDTQLVLREVIIRSLACEPLIRQALSIVLTREQAAATAEDLLHGAPDPCEACAAHGVTDYSHSIDDHGGAL